MCLAVISPILFKIGEWMKRGEKKIIPQNIKFSLIPPDYILNRSDFFK